MRASSLAGVIGVAVLVAWSAGVSAKTAKAAPKAIHREIDLAATNLDPKSIGIEISDLMPALKPPVKGEFETTDEFIDRQGVYSKTKILGELTPSSLFAVSGGGWFSANISTRYLADTGVLVVEPGPSVVPLVVREKQWLWAPLENRHKKVATQLKRNAYGTTMDVDRVKISIDGLAFTDGSVKLKPGQRGLSYEIKIDAAAAKALKDHVGVLYIGRLVAPFVVENDWYQNATWSDPRDIELKHRAAVMDVQELWIVNTTTGRVLHKAKSPLMTPDAPVEPIP